MACRPQPAPRCRAEVFAGAEAGAVRRLRAAGALIAGKTVTTNFAMFAPGPTRNPRDPRTRPAGQQRLGRRRGRGLVPLALGTQTIASVIRPAAYCGVAGYRPTHGRIPADGVIPFAPSLDAVGCFAAGAAGLARAAAVLCNDCGAAAAAVAARPRHPGRSLPGAGKPSGADCVRRHAAALSAAGYVVREVPELADMDEVERLLVVISRYEAAQVHARWFARYAGAVPACYGSADPPGPGLHGRRLRARHRGRQGELARRLADTAADAGIDAWLTPAATGPAPSGLTSTGDPVMSLPWSLAGLPALALPAGLVAGLPVGVAGRRPQRAPTSRSCAGPRDWSWPWPAWTGRPVLADRAKLDLRA